MLLCSSITKRATPAGPFCAVTDSGGSGAFGTFGRSVGVKSLLGRLFCPCHPSMVVRAIHRCAMSFIPAETRRSGVLVTPRNGGNATALSLAILTLAVAFVILALSFAFIVLAFAFTFALIFLAFSFALAEGSFAFAE